SMNDSSNALFVVWAGPVDFYFHILPYSDGWGITVPPTNDHFWDIAIADSINNLSNAVVRLYALGARSFLVPNIDDVSRQPVVVRTQTAATRASLQKRVQEFNAALAQSLASLDHLLTEVRIVSPDAVTVFSDLIDHSAKYGLTKAYPAAWQDPALT